MSDPALPAPAVPVAPVVPVVPVVPASAVPVTPGLTLMAMGGSAAAFTIVDWLGATLLHLPGWNATLANAIVVLACVIAHWLGDQFWARKPAAAVPAAVVPPMSPMSPVPPVPPVEPTPQPQ